MNPYSGTSFFEFFAVLFSRVFSRHGESFHLASDEIQLMALLGLAVCTSILGGVLYMKKMMMAAGALSHTILLGIVLAFLVLKAMGATFFLSIHALPTLLLGGGIAALLTLFFNEILHHKLGVEKGASIGLVFTTLFATSLLLVSVCLKNTHIGIESIMGNIDGLHRDDLKGVGALVLINIVFIVAFFKPLVVSAFDPIFASIVGVKEGRLKFILMILLALTATLFFRVVGVFLFLAFLVVPLFFARGWTAKLKPLLVLSCALSCLGAFLGVALSRHVLSNYGLPLSSSSLVVLTTLVLGLSLFVIKAGKTMVINRKKSYTKKKMHPVKG